MPIQTHSLGHPRIGEKRELKKALESHWKGQSTLADLQAAGQAVRRRNWLAQREAGLDLIPSNDFSFYDQVLDLSCLVGNVPPRFGSFTGEIGLDTAFAIARGLARECGRGHPHPADAHASEMTKWFDTNYHYIVPEFHAETAFRLASSKIFDEFSEALALGIRTKPVLLGPVTYLVLGKMNVDEASPPRPARTVEETSALRAGPLSLLDRLLPVYVQVLQKLASLGAEWVQLDEPVFALDLNAAQRGALVHAYAALSKAAPGLKLLVATYYGGLRDNLPDFLRLPVHALHVDLTRAPEELDAILAGLGPDKRLSLGLVDGRNIWRHPPSASEPLLRKALAALGSDRILVAPSCSLQHVPVTLRHETKLDPGLKSRLAFADEKLGEVVALGGTGVSPVPISNFRSQISNHGQDARATPPPSHFRRPSPFPVRQALQHKRLNLPLFPTTTIGSFPQTDAIRAARARWKKGELSTPDYESFLEKETASCVRFQEEIGVDVLVHGEFERNDMVEYFGEQLDGFAFTENGWVQSYGSRCVKPPIIHGEVARPRPMTVRWSAYAQSLTRRPMKGMLTGPVTVLQWSFVRDDQPRRDTAFQIALALREEVVDLEKAGIAAIQIDEPAIREGLPLRRADWTAYLQWAVEAFRLCSSGVRDDTQIDTHMCYSEFNDIITAIAALDADVITIETSRSNMELLRAFSDFKYPNEIGPGVYDIHSPRVPEVGEMETLMAKAAEVLPVRNLWVNPDCGLKTRGWAEVKPALAGMVEAARRLRQRFA